MAARKLKCYGWCGEKWPKEDLTKYKNQNFCRDCYRRKVKESEGLQTLHAVIQQIFNIPFANGHMLRQIKTFHNERGYDYEDMAKAILYSKHILKKQMHVKYGLGLIPYVIEDAKKYYEDQQNRVENMKGKLISSENKVVKQKYYSYDRDVNKNKKIIDMEDIL